MPKIALGRPGKPEGMYYTLIIILNFMYFALIMMICRGW